MKKLKERIRKKLKGHAGESIAEVLIALLIAALALTMLASIITSTSRMLTKSKAKMAEYYDANKAVVEQAYDPSMTAKPFTLTDKASDTKAYYLFDATDMTSVYCFENDKAAKAKVISYTLKK